MAVKLIVGAAAIDKAIASIKNRGAKLDGDIQIAALSVLSHIDQHGDYTVSDRLLSAMPKGVRRNALVGWMVAYGKVALLDKKLPEDAEKIKAGGVFKFDREKQTDMATAEATPWHTFKHTDGAPTEVFDVQKAVTQLLKRVQAMQAKGTKIEHAEMVEALAKLSA